MRNRSSVVSLAVITAALSGVGYFFYDEVRSTYYSGLSSFESGQITVNGRAKKKYPDFNQSMRILLSEEKEILKIDEAAVQSERILYGITGTSEEEFLDKYSEVIYLSN